MPKARPLEERFWEKVGICGESECWEWAGGKDELGYGAVYISTIAGKRRYGRAHRVAYLLIYGEINEGLDVLHRCDNRACCNPAHLFTGTHQDNMQDRNQKGRQARGSKNGRAKLSDADVINLRELYATGDYSTVELSARFGLSSTATEHVISGENWRHLPVQRLDREARMKRQARGERCGGSKLTDEQVLEMRRLYKLGDYSYSKLGKQFGVSAANTFNIIKGKYWRHLPL
jgi:hypothetical protein